MASTINNCSGNKSTENENGDITYEPNKKIRKLDTSSLVSAIKKQDIKKVRQFLIQQKCDYIPESNMDTPLHHAAEGGNMEIVKLVFNHGYGTVNAVNIQSKTPLQLAIKNNHEDVIKYLLENGAKNALSFAELENLIRSYVKSDKLKILKSLVKEEMISHNTINFAVQENCLKSLKCMLEFGIIVNKTPLFDFLHTAAKNGNLEIVKLLFHKGFDVIGAENCRQQIPLHLAMEEGHDEVMKFLLDNGAGKKLSFKEFNDLIQNSIINNCLRTLKSLNSKDTISDSVINFVASNGHLEILKILMECGVKIIWNSSERPLQSAIRCGHLDIVKYLIESYVPKRRDANFKLQFNSETPFLCAAMHGHLEIVQYFLEKGFFINEVNLFNGLTPLELAVSKGQLVIVKQLLKEQTAGNINYHKKRNGKNNSLLHYAACHGHLDILKYLIEYGADINVKVNNETPLHKAIRLGHADIVRELLEQGAKEFDVPKDISVPRVKEEIFTLLLKAGHSLEAYFGGRKPILIAAQLGYTKLVEALLSSGVDVNTKESSYETALNMAVTARQAEVVSILLKAGANLKGTIKTRLKPLEYCISGDYWNDDFKTQKEILRNLLNHVPNGDLQQMVVSCINFAVKEKAPITIIDVLLAYDFNNKYELTVHCLKSRIYMFRALIYHTEKVETLSTFLNSISQKHCGCCTEDAVYLAISRIIFLLSLIGKFATHCTEYCKKCQKEIASMKETKILPGELNVTYYDFLAKPIHKVVNYIRNEKLMTNLNYNGFVVYKEFFERKISRAKSRSLYIDQSRKLFYNGILNGFQIHLPSEIVNKIFEYLSVVQLQHFQEALA